MPRTNRNETTRTRYVELIRVSGRGQVERETPEMQRVALDAMAEGRPGQRITRIEALAVSGAVPLEKTTHGRELLALAAEGFDELRLWDVDRGLGARADDPRDRLALFGIALEAGAVLVDCNGRVIDPTKEMGELDYYLRTFFARQERAKILARTMAGKQRALAEGRLPYSQTPYGLRYNRETADIGIYEPEATIAREIFERIVSRHSCPDIALDLNGRGVPTGLRQRKNAAPEWTRERVYRIARHPVYRGEWLVNRAERRVFRVPAIVTDDLWFAAQDELSKSNRRGLRQTRHTYLLEGLARCALCGARISVSAASPKRRRPAYYFCPGRRSRSPDRCTLPMRQVRDVDSRVWRRLCQLLSDEWQDVAAALAEQDAAARASSAGWESDVRDYEARLGHLADAESTALALFRRARVSRDGLEREIESIARERTLLGRQLATARQVAACAARIDLAGLESMVAAIRRRLPNAPPQVQQRVVQALVPGVDDDVVILGPWVIEASVVVSGATLGACGATVKAERCSQEQRGSMGATDEGIRLRLIA